MVERTAGNWVKLWKTEFAGNVGALLMVVTHSGMVGVAVASHVTEGLGTVLVRVPTRNLHMAEEVAGDWGGEHKHKHAIRINAQWLHVTQAGLHGPFVALHAGMEPKLAPAHALNRRFQMEDRPAKDSQKRKGYVEVEYVQNQPLKHVHPVKISRLTGSAPSTKACAV